MEKQKRWHLLLILSVLILTVYNILPTVFYYTNPLRAPIDEQRSTQIAQSIAARVDGMEQDTLDWVQAYARHLGLKTQSVAIDSEDPRLVRATFKTERDAEYFKGFVDEAAKRIPFVPAQLALGIQGVWKDPSTVTLERRIGVRLDPEKLNQLFTFSWKTENHQPAPLYKTLVYDRVASLGASLGGVSRQGIEARLLTQTGDQATNTDNLLEIAKEILDYHDNFGVDHPLTQRFFANFALVAQKGEAAQPTALAGLIEKAAQRLESRKSALLVEQKKAVEEGKFADPATEQLIGVIENQGRVLTQAAKILRDNAARFATDEQPFTRDKLLKALAASGPTAQEDVQRLSLGNRHHLFSGLTIDWANDRVMLTLHPEVATLRNRQALSEWDQFKKERLNQIIINEIARISRQTEETISPRLDDFAVSLSQLPDSRSLLVMDLGDIAGQMTHNLRSRLERDWHPQHQDLSRDVFPIMDYAAFQKLPLQERQLGLVVYNPYLQEQPISGFHGGSLYVIAKGMQTILQKYADYPEDTDGQQLARDLNSLQGLMRERGFIAYRPEAYGLDSSFAQDVIFALPGFYQNLVKATRENFQTLGSKRYACLEFSDVEQRILTLNRIEQETHEDLLKWREEYHTAQVDLNPMTKYLVPAPTKNAYWENFKINWRKYFRGDDRKILRWGLDLSGGKSVRIGLRDPNNRPVTDPAQLNTAVNELYTRINAMGVSERTIRVENNNILLDFPGVQGLSAAELVKASAMYFHIVNEKFSTDNPSLKEAVNQFLQEVWNEAVVTNRKDVTSLNEIAWQHLGGDNEAEGALRPRSENARVLYDAGLRLAGPKETNISNAFNDTLSSIAVWRGEDMAQWHGQTHPLMIVFRNYALEGSSLENIQPGYDPSKGNILTFGVQSSYTGDRRGNPRDDFYAWTSQFAEEKVVGTPLEAYSRGKGWRMAVVLNGQVVSAPYLTAPLRDNALIQGNFSQREINRLAADLKAGSLSFTPRILSETNVSPELGKEERLHGIAAAAIGLALVVACMVGYYRFGGIVASFAVICNLLIIWGVLQNLDAALTLPGIAGIILTVGMAVDANVLVFERIREELKATGRLASAVQAGYRKAFNAIFDSNITTIMAALILIQFDSGPIKGFAVTIIIGVASSMFTALFMTRYFFAGWVRNPKHTDLSMADLIGEPKFNFLAYARPAIIASLVLIAVGSGALFKEWQNILGMDFTGGYSLALELEETPGVTSYRTKTLDSLLSEGAHLGDVQVRELNRPYQLRIQLGRSMEEEGHPFYGMPESLEIEDPAYSYQLNPRVNWVVDALSKAGLEVRKSQLPSLDKNWNQMSGQFSSVMRNNALWALGLAMACILLYLTVRFEFKYAISALIALAHDVMISLGLLGVLVYFGLPMQIDLQVIGAIMLIIGYSLNDTIIVFDRIRDDVRLYRKWDFAEVINHALSVTLSRTLMTSGTTLLVLLSLVFLGGSSIFDLALVMTIGVAFGTLSSLFVAPPVLLFFHRRELRQQAKDLSLKRA